MKLYKEADSLQDMGFYVSNRLYDICDERAAAAWDKVAKLINMFTSAHPGVMDWELQEEARLRMQKLLWAELQHHKNYKLFV